MAGELAHGDAPAPAPEHAPALAPEDGFSARRIAARLRQTASAVAGSPAAERRPVGDLDHLHRAFDLTAVPIASQRRVGGSLVVALKRSLRRLLFPLLDVQTSVNGANARVVSFLLAELEAQERRIEELERRIAERRDG
jgi:hypothetical protein